MRMRSLVRIGAIATVLVLVAAACSRNPGGGGAAPSSGSVSASPTKGGSIVVAAEQWPQCLNPITSCSEAAWAYYTVLQQVLPRALQWGVDGTPQASPLVTEVPSLDNGGITNKPFTITYKLNPNANWNDGTPITSADFDFTWKAILNTRGALSTFGYDLIKSIDTSDPKTVVITFKQVFADWPDLFGGQTGSILEKAAFPNADPNKPDLSGEMQTSYPFAGGPWVLQSWDKQTAVLSRNDNYFGQVPLLDQVTFIRRQVQSTEINSLLSGESAAIYPQPSDVSLLKQFATNPNVQSVGGNSTYTEALWFNLTAAPLNDPQVRQAFAYAVDRQAVIDGVIKLNNPQAEVINCPLLALPGTPWCQSTPFAQYTYDPAKAMQILQSAGYDCSASPCTKNGQALQFEYAITAGNTRRAATAAIVKERAAAAGFQLDIKAYDPTDLFSNKLPKLDYTMAEFANSIGYDPSVTGVFACDQIPSASNGYSGTNTDAWCNQQATSLMDKSDLQLNEAKRAALIDQIGQIEAQDLPALPLFNLPNVSAWRTDKVAGPLGTWNSSPYGLFFNMEEWYLPS